MPAAPIPHSRPDLTAHEAEAAAAAVRSGVVAQGDRVAAFEAEVAGVVGRAHAVAVASGTAALHLTLQGLGVAGARVLVPSYVCTALVHATRAAGGQVRVVDVDAATGNLDEAPEVDAGAVAVVPHMFGRPAGATADLAAHGAVVEDLAMALGSDGVGRHGVAAVCSFYATKVITAGGEGGMVLTDDSGLAQALREVRDYDGRSLGRQRWNVKLTDVAAAVGRVQLARLPALVRRRRQLAARYDEALAGLPARRLAPTPASNAFRYVLLVDDGVDVDAAIAALEALGVAARRPVPEPLHRGLGLAATDYPGTEDLWRRALSLPLYPALTDDEAGRVAAAARRVLEAAVVAETAC